jgi:hypothetical protein
MNEQLILDRAQADEDATRQRIAQLEAEIVTQQHHLEEINLFRTMLAGYMRQGGEPGTVESEPARGAAAELGSYAPSAVVDELRGEIRNLYRCDSVWIEGVSVREQVRGETMWEGQVEVFDLIGSTEADRAYAWVQVSGNSGNRQFFIMLHRPPVDSAQMAVRAALVGQYRGRTG